jgi:cell division protein FtsB
LVQRTIAVVATFALLLVSFVSSFSVYLGQQRDIAQVREQIAQQRAEIERLQDELERWQDPAYVRAQARDRLGWVMPGEVGYRVVDENGQVIGGTMTDPDGDSAAVSVTWYEALRDSLKVADQPVPDAQEPEDSRIFDPDDDESPR